MKIGITAQGNNLDALIDQRFGRSKYFIIVDSDTLQFKAIENKEINGMGGVGISSARLLVNEEIEVLITGDMGPNASQVFASSSVKIITGVSGTIREAIEKIAEKK